MSEADEPTSRDPGRRNRFRGPFRGWTVLAVVLVLVAGVLVSWAVTGRHPTGGQAEPGAPDSTSAPAIPAHLTAAMDHAAVLLAWQAATGTHTVTGYAVYRDGARVASVWRATTWRDTTPPAGSHRYQVQSVDSTGTGSPLSPSVSIAVPGPTTTTPPTTTHHAATAAPPPPPAPPLPASWPTPASTGASGPLTTVNGDVTLAKQGQVYANKRVKGTLTVTACDVTIRNVEVDSGEPYTGDSTPDLFAIWLQESAACGVTIDHVSTITGSAPDVYVTTSIRSGRGGPVTITDSKLIGAQLGILGISSGTVRDNYVQLGTTMRGDHNDAIQADGSSGLTIHHNTLLNPNEQTSALALYTEYGNNSNDVVSDNLLAGGGYTCYCGDGATDNNGQPARAHNVDVVDNVFWRKYFPAAGEFGAGRAFNPAGGGQWAGNVYMNADGTLTGQQVPQPGLDGQ
jgi:hypothetical protein